MENPFVVLLIAVLGPVAMYFLWTRADKIRQSRLWFAAAIGWIYASAYTVGAWSLILGEVGVEMPPDEVFVPYFFGFMMLMLLVVGYFNIYRPYRKFKKANRQYEKDFGKS